ncbi:hypothetical protein Daus18300_004285 [Diaporthe australafricana]|uniref:Uncharacterized protein n=1 Tax=Diaporthe australafricana TaxID=127596 RepID=A0ABR3X9X2_9PEZI
MSKQPAAASKSLLLDYVSQFQPLALYRSLENKDFTVSAATAVSILLKIMVILSTGLITLSMTAVHEGAIPMVLQNNFLDDNTTLASAGTLPRYFMLGFQDDTVEYPPGISKDFAFQTVETSFPPTAQIQVTVDGLTNSLQCEPAILELNEARDAGSGKISKVNLTITTPSCEIAEVEMRGPDDVSEDELPYSTTFGQFSEVQCDGTTDDGGRRVLVWFGQMEWFADETISTDCTKYCSGKRTRGRLLHSAQLLCRPTYDISKVDIINNGTETQTVTLSHSSGTQNRTLDHVTPWSIMRALYEAFDATSGGSKWRESFNLGGEIIDVDSYTRVLLQSQLPAGTNAPSLYDLNLLEAMAQSFYRQFGAIIARQSLLKTERIKTTGSALFMRSRLIVQSWSGQWMAGLAAACLLLTLTTTLMAPKHGILPCSPGTLFGLAVIVSHSTKPLIRLREAGDADSESLSQSLQSSTFQSGIVHTSSSRPSQFAIQDTAGIEVDKEAQPFRQSRSSHTHPALLHPWVRLTLCVAFFAVVAALEVTLQESNKKEGLGNVSDDTYIHYLWTAMPALLLEGFLLVISSMDFNIRSLAPHLILRDIVTTEVFMNAELLDMSTPWATYKEVRLRSLGAFATTSALLIASFFTIFSSSLFQATSLKQIGPIALEMQNFVASNSFNGSAFSRGGITASLILEGNLSYPKFTYEDLVFPQMLPVGLMTRDSISNSSSLSTRALVPAVRTHLTCHMYNSSSVHVPEYDGSNDGLPLYIHVDGTTCDQASGGKVLFYNVTDIRDMNVSYFGLGVDVDTSVESCSDLFYVWGRLDYASDTPLQHAAAISCKETFEVVDVDVEFVGADLAIDPLRPPKPLEGTARKSTVSADRLQSSLYSYIPSVARTDMISRVFALLTTSRWAIPLSMLGDPAHDLEVAAALKFQHGILAAQALNSNRKPPLNVSATEARIVSTAMPSGRDGARYTYGATVTDGAGRRRVVQDGPSTRVLQALLFATALLMLLSWACYLRTDLLPPRSPTTVAGAVALLAGGNLLDLLPEDAEWRSKTDIMEALGRQTKFLLCWDRMPDAERIAEGSENENGVSRFGIFAMPPDEGTGSEASLEQR